MGFKRVGSDQLRLLAGVAALTAAVQALLWPYFLDDAYMHVRYAQNIVASGVWGLWNVGEDPVSGDSSPLWLALLVILRAVGLAPVVSAKLLGGLALICHLLDVTRFYANRRPDAGRWEIGAFAVSLFSLVPLVVYAASGMETILFVFLVGRLTLGSSGLPWSAAAVAVTLIRPEGGLFVLALALARHAPAWPKVLRSGAPALTALVLYLVVHRWYFGYWMPNTYYAKADLPTLHALVYGLRAITLFLKDYYFVIAFALIAILHGPRGRAEWQLGALASAVLILVLRTGGDNAAAFPHHRHMLPVLGMCWAYAVIAARRICLTGPAPRLVMALLVASMALSHLVSEGRTQSSPLNGTKAAIKSLFRIPSVGQDTPPTALPDVFDLLDELPDGELVATCSAGKRPALYLNLRFIDMLGLNDEHIARHGTRQYGQVDAKSDAGYVMEREPGVIELPIPSRHLQAGQVARGITHWRILVDDLLSDERLTTRYRFLPTSDRAVFLHSRLLPALPEGLRGSAREYP